MAFVVSAAAAAAAAATDLGLAITPAQWEEEVAAVHSIISSAVRFSSSVSWARSPRRRAMARCRPVGDGGVESQAGMTEKRLSSRVGHGGGATAAHCHHHSLSPAAVSVCTHPIPARPGNWRTSPTAAELDVAVIGELLEAVSEGALDLVRGGRTIIVSGSTLVPRPARRRS